MAGPDPKDRKAKLRAALNILDQRYTQLIDAVKKPSSSWHQRLLCFLTKKNGSRFKNKVTLCSRDDSKSLRSVSEVSQAINPCLSTQEEDAFRMKAISLIQKHGIAFPSIEDALKTLRQTPIFTTLSNDKKEGSLSASSVIFLSQTVTPFPGETLILKGAFKRHPDKPIPSTPILESFGLTFESVQTGFPSPLQYTGWALSDTLIPQRLPLEKTSLLFVLLEKKKEAATALKGFTPQRLKAQHLLKLKRESAEQQLESFIALHRELSLALLKAAPQSFLEHEDAILQFFSWLENQSSPYTKLASIFSDFNHRFLVKTYTVLQQAWNEQIHSLNDQPNERHRAAAELLKMAWKTEYNELEQSPLDKKIKEFQKCLAYLVGIPVQSIFLQYFSEPMGFSPSPLSKFEQTLQLLAFEQLEKFLQELDESLPPYPFEKITRQLVSATEHVQRQKPHSQLVEEVGRVYSHL